MSDDATGVVVAGGPHEVVSTCPGCGARYAAVAYLGLSFGGRQVRALEPSAIRRDGRAGYVLLRDCACGHALSVPVPRFLVGAAPPAVPSAKPSPRT